MKNSAKIIIIASILGFLNALFLLIAFLQAVISHSKVISFCKINEVFSCTGSLTAPISQILGLPVGAIVVFVYPVLGGLAYWASYSKKPQNQYFAIAILAGMGTAMSVLTNYNEYHYLHTVCLICLVCLVIISTILVTAIMGFKQAGAKK